MLFRAVRLARAASCSVVLAALAVLPPACALKSTKCPDVTCFNTTTVKLDVPYDYAQLTGKSVDVCRGQACTHFTFPKNAQSGSGGYDCPASDPHASCTVQVSGGASQISIQLIIQPPFPKGDQYHVTFRDDATGKAEIDAYRAVKYTYSMILQGHPECGGCAGTEITLQPGAPQYADCTSGTCISS